MPQPKNRPGETTVNLRGINAALYHRLKVDAAERGVRERELINIILEERYASQVKEKP